MLCYDVYSWIVSDNYIEIGLVYFYMSVYKCVFSVFVHQNEILLN